MEPILHRDARHHDLSSKQLRGPGFAHPVAGVAVLAADRDDVAVRSRAALAVLPVGTVVTHLTAARLRGWWLPHLTDEPVIVCTDSTAPHHDRRGVYVRRCGIPARHRTALQGIAVASPEWTIIELAETLSFLDLVVVIDSALACGDLTLDSLRTSLVPGRRGVRNLRKALLYCDGRSQSPGESVLRLVHTLVGIPVDVQAEYRDDDGTLLAMVDLRVRGTQYAPEYDGAPHRDAATHRRDLRRERLLHALGVRRAGFTVTEIRQQTDEIVRAAAAALGRPWAFSAADVRPEIDRSSITRAGMAGLERRMRRFARPTPPRRTA